MISETMAKAGRAMIVDFRMAKCPKKCAATERANLRQWVRRNDPVADRSIRIIARLAFKTGRAKIIINALRN